MNDRALDRLREALEAQEKGNGFSGMRQYELLLAVRDAARAVLSSNVLAEGWSYDMEAAPKDGVPLEIAVTIPRINGTLLPLVNDGYWHTFPDGVQLLCSDTGIAYSVYAWRIKPKTVPPPAPPSEVAG